MNRFNIRVILKVASKDVKVLVKQRSTLLYLFVIPVVFILAFSGFGRVGSGPKEEAIPLPVANLDASSAASLALIDALNEGGGIVCELYEEERAMAQLDRGKLDRLLVIPANFGADLQTGQPATLRLVEAADASETMSEAIYRAVSGVTAQLSLETQLIASFRQMADMEAAASREQRAFTSDLIVEQAQSQFARAKTEPLLAIEESWPEHMVVDDGPGFRDLGVSVPGFAILFVFLTAQTTAQAIYEEKRVGSFRRLRAAPISKATILIGKMVPNFVTGLIQIVVLFGTGFLVFPALGLGSLSLGNDPLALVVVCLIILLCSTSLGVLIAAIARTEGQIGGLSHVILWVCGFAGILLAQMPSDPLFDMLSRAIPHYWANAAFQDLFIRGQGLADIVPSILALLGFTFVFLTVGLWRFEYE